MTAGEFGRGIFAQNPVFRVALGVCPALAVTATMADALVMSGLVMAVLAASNLAVSITRNLIAQRVRIPCQILIITAFASMANMLLLNRSPHFSAALGIYVPLIAVNCLILNRADAFAAKNKPIASLLDAIVVGIGFTVALLACSMIRELFGNFSLMGQKVIPGHQPFLALTTACGAFFSLAFVLGLYNYFMAQKGKEKA
jgi:electron transport complex protein RnfE